MGAGESGAMEVSLLDLTTDDLERVFCECDSAAVCALYRSSHAINGVARSDAVWSTLLEREYGLRQEDMLATSGGTREGARKLYTRMATEEPRLLHAEGFFTDAGVDGRDELLDVQLDDMEAKHVELTAEDQRYWVANAFNNDEWAVYCSATGQRNGLIGTSLTSASTASIMPEALLASKLSEREMRAYLVERLSFLGENGYNLNGFGGLDSYPTEDLHDLFSSVWDSPQLRPMLLEGLPVDTRSIQHHRAKLARIAANPPISRDQRSISLLRIGKMALLVDSAEAKRHKAERHDAEPTLSPAKRAERPIISPTGGLAVLSAITVRRAPLCSCPLECGVVFGCRASRPLTNPHAIM